MIDAINEIVTHTSQIVLWLKPTLYLILGIFVIWVISIIRRNVGLDNHTIELKPIMHILENQTLEQ